MGMKRIAVADIMAELKQNMDKQDIDDLFSDKSTHKKEKKENEEIA